MMAVGLITVIQGYKKILQVYSRRKQNSLVLQTSKDLTVLESQHKFDSDSEEIIVDNLANCIVWKDKKSFVQESYRELDMATSPSFDTVAGAENAVGIEDLEISWKDSNGKNYQFTLQNAYYMPDSPVNILGLSEFSKCIEDYDTRGTRINSSGQNSIFTWNSGKYKHTFSHSNANMPALLVKDGYYRFHKFCNFIEKMIPKNLQCYHVRDQSKFRDQLLYDVEEDIIYQNSDHIKKGIIERITYENDMKIPHYHIKFKDNRMVKVKADNLRCPTSENNLATVPITPQDYLDQPKNLIEEDLQFVQNPTPLTSLEQEWLSLHNKYGHLSFTQMDKLVENNM